MYSKQVIRGKVLEKLAFELDLGGGVGFWQQGGNKGKKRLNKNKKEWKWMTCLGIYAFTLLPFIY